MKNEDKDTDNEAEKSSMMLQIIKQFDLNCIIDRLYISDYVYGKTERKYAENCLDNLYALNALLSTMENEVIFIIPEDVTDEGLPLLARDVAKRIEGELEYPGQIKVSLIRETRSVEYAK